MKPILRNTLYLLLALAVSAGGYLAYRQATAPSLEERYRIETIERGDLLQTVAANGTLNPVVLVNVGTQVSGTVTRLFVDFNDKVTKGQPLIELDRSLLEAQARQSQAYIGSVAASLDLARANEARMRALFAEEYVSRQEYDQAVQSRKSLEAQFEQARATAQKDQVNLGYTIIRSPVSGIVVDRVVDLGQTVAASFQTPTLIKIAQDLSEMRIDTSFAEADLGKIRVGQSVKFSVDAFPNRNFVGQVQQIRLNPVTTQNVVTYNVRISLDNPDEILLPGMTAYVNIAVDERKDALLVPNAALRFKPAEAADKKADKDKAAERGNGRRGGGDGKGRKRDGSSGTVYVIDGKELRPVRVELGITDNRNTEVVGGELKPGDRVLTGDNPDFANGKPSSVGMRLF